ncbi:S66 peptidase family protein [Iodobacter sp. LRB]|uniref:S66 family peptidase n=1 Tax=unclassified Iodobacter TaxID=235634 RepID=UPI000C0E4BB9|nr:S66 peptidase family protein [Iodobacter sp. BJB302]PHV03450.1 LD-carboxypeptidase [Iodobacter sp. BJB302]
MLEFLPGFLKKGDTIGFFSPSWPATFFVPKRFERAKQYLLNQGYKLKEGKLTGQEQGYRSGSIAARAEELNDLIRDPDVRCIMSVIGGSNSNSLLPYLDYEAFKADPKIVVGYSDVTAILLALYAKTNVPVFYGPALVASLGEFPPLVDETFGYFESLVSQQFKLPHAFPTPLQWTETRISWEEQISAKPVQENQWLSLNGGKARGRLIGGNLNTMLAVWGTPYMPEIKQGDILLIEDSLKDSATMERLFSFLKLQGVFERAGGILLGKHELFSGNYRPHEILLEVMGKPNIPVIAEFDCCHTHPMLTMMIGSMVEIDADILQVTMLAE